MTDEPTTVDEGYGWGLRQRRLVLPGDVLLRRGPDSRWQAIYSGPFFECRSREMRSREDALRDLRDRVVSSEGLPREDRQGRPVKYAQGVSVDREVLVPVSIFAGFFVLGCALIYLGLYLL